MRIDAHQHFWRLARGDYGWLTPEASPSLYRDFGPADLAPLMADAGVTQAVEEMGEVLKQHKTFP